MPRGTRRRPSSERRRPGGVPRAWGSGWTACAVVAEAAERAEAEPPEPPEPIQADRPAPPPRAA
jgi:hypothetical protein